MRGVHIFEKPCYREIRVMRGRAMRGLPVLRIFPALDIPCSIGRKAGFSKYCILFQFLSYVTHIAVSSYAKTANTVLKLPKLIHILQSREFWHSS